MPFFMEACACPVAEAVAQGRWRRGGRDARAVRGGARRKRSHNSTRRADENVRKPASTTSKQVNISITERQRSTSDNNRGGAATTAGQRLSPDRHGGGGHGHGGRDLRHRRFDRQRASARCIPVNYRIIYSSAARLVSAQARVLDYPPYYPARGAA